MPKFIKSIADIVVRRVGLELVPNWRLPTLAQEQYLRRLFGKFEIDVVLDVGANAGQYANFLRNAVEYKGWIVSYEPDPDTAALVGSRAARDAKWEVVICALGSAPGAAEFNIMAGSELNSFLEPSNEALKRFETDKKVTRRIPVELRTVEAEWARLKQSLGVRRPYLKLDTQGFDLEVVAGAVSALPEIPALQSEMSVIPIYAGMPDMATSVSRLRGIGYELSGLFPVTSKHFPLLVEVDGHFVRNELLEEVRCQRYLPA